MEPQHKGNTQESPRLVFPNELTLPVNANGTTRDVKNEVHVSFGIPPNQQRLIFRERGIEFILADDDLHNKSTRQQEGEDRETATLYSRAPLDAAVIKRISTLEVRKPRYGQAILTGIIVGGAAGAAAGAGAGVIAGCCGGPFALITIPQGLVFGIVAGGIFGAIGGALLTCTVDQVLVIYANNLVHEETDKSIQRQDRQIAEQGVQILTLTEQVKTLHDTGRTLLVERDALRQTQLPVCVLCDNIAMMAHRPCGCVAYCQNCREGVERTNGGGRRCPKCRQEVQECYAVNYE